MRWDPEAISRQKSLHGVRRYLEGLRQLSIRLRVESAEGDAVEVGASRLGGRPDLPADIAWPTRGGVPLDFLAQIRLADLSSSATGGRLPQNGWLWFFFDKNEWEPCDPSAWRVMYCEDPGARLETRLSGQPRRQEVARGLPVRFSREWTLPDACDLARSALCGRRSVVTKQLADGTKKDECISPGPLSPRLLEAYQTLEEELGKEDGAKHRMLGYPDELQEMHFLLALEGADRRWVCLGYDDPRPIRSSEKVPGQTLLLQLDSDRLLGQSWGDGGRLYFWIAESDLLTRRFERVWVTLASC